VSERDWTAGDRAEQISAMTPTPRYPNGNVALDVKSLAILGEQIAIASLNVTDSDGKRISVMGDLSVLENLAAQVVGQWLHCQVWKMDAERGPDGR
jgi:hypothetical protein